MPEGLGDKMTGSERPLGLSTSTGRAAGQPAWGPPARRWRPFTRGGHARALGCRCVRRGAGSRHLGGGADCSPGALLRTVSEPAASALCRRRGRVGPLVLQSRSVLAGSHACEAQVMRADRGLFSPDPGQQAPGRGQSVVGRVGPGATVPGFLSQPVFVGLAYEFLMAEGRQLVAHAADAPAFPKGKVNQLISQRTCRAVAPTTSVRRTLPDARHRQGP